MLLWPLPTNNWVIPQMCMFGSCGPWKHLWLDLDANAATEASWAILEELPAPVRVGGWRRSWNGASPEWWQPLSFQGSTKPWGSRFACCAWNPFQATWEPLQEGLEKLQLICRCCWQLTSRLGAALCKVLSIHIGLLLIFLFNINFL